MAACKTIKIDVISDFICAWCYIGHIELERGMALAQAAALPVDFAVQYHPFILHPSLADDTPISKEAFYRRKMGSDRWKAVVDLVVARAKEEGLEFTFGGVMSQTTSAHRLLQKAYLVGGQNAQLALLKVLFRAFFEQDKDIGDARTLAALAVEADNEVSSREGAPRLFASEEEALRWIEGDELEDAVRAMSADAQRKGVTGVPFTVIDGKWAVSGCQTPECYFKIFEKLATSDTLLPTPTHTPVPKTAVASS